MYEKEKFYNLLALYLAHFFWTMATLMLLSTVSIYHEVVLNISKINLGSIQAYATLSAYGSKLMSGILVDMFKNYRFMILLGSSISMFAKPSFAFVQSTYGIFFLRSFERVTKGLRSAPTDAFINTLQKKEESGRAFALKQFSYTMGAVFGCFAASLILFYTKNDFVLTYKCSLIPGLLSTIIIFFGIYRKKSRVNVETKTRKKFKWQELKEIPPVLWVVLLLAFFMTTARFGETFLSHRFYEAGYPIFKIPLAYIFFDLPFSLISLYSMRIYDALDWRKILSLGMLLLLFSNVCLALSNKIEYLLLGTVFAGLHMGVTQGLFLTVIAKLCPPHIQGTTYAIYYTVFGIGTFTSSKITGYLSYYFESWRAGFVSGLIISLIVFIVMLFITNSKHKKYQKILDNEK